MVSEIRRDQTKAFCSLQSTGTLGIMLHASSCSHSACPLFSLATQAFLFQEHKMIFLAQGILYLLFHYLKLCIFSQLAPYLEKLPQMPAPCLLSWVCSDHPNESSHPTSTYCLYCIMLLKPFSCISYTFLNVRMFIVCTAHQNISFKRTLTVWVLFPRVHTPKA